MLAPPPLPPRTAISKPVGTGAERLGGNQRSDVALVQVALAAASSLVLDPRLHPGNPDGSSGDGTEGAIEWFQRRIGLTRPDGRIDPGGYTLARLNALLKIGQVQFGFPFSQSSRWPYTGSGAGMRAFGARRSSGSRAHAGVDIYQPDYTPVYAMADGVVTRGPYGFYLRTNAIEIDHGACVIRYGELRPDNTPPVKQGDRVRKGQLIGEVGVLIQKNGRRLGVPSMMLHLEMYDKTATGALTRAASTSARWTTGKPFMRRRDLVDPSGFLFRAPLRS